MNSKIANSTWISVKKTAVLLNKNVRTIQRLCKKDKFVTRILPAKGRGGKKIEILLSSLPEEAIARYHHLEPVRNEVEEMEGFSKKQKADANNKAWILELYRKRDRGMTVDQFLEWYNQEHGGTVTKANLFQWQRKLKKGGPAALVDHRGEYKRGTTSIPDEAWDYFYALYMTQQKRGVQLCYDYTRKEYPDIPSVYAFHRRVKTIPQYALIRYREGENALRDILPSMDRDKKDVKSNDIWFSDHHRIDVFTLTADGSRLCRLWLTVFFDARSDKVVSYICRNADPDAAVIKQALRKGMETHGIPRELYFDNGKDYRSKAFQQDFPLSIVHQLGIGNIYATPYHGQAKPVERFFRTFEERFGKMFPAYTGKDAKNRPEQMQVPDKKIKAYATTIEQFQAALDNYMEDYNQTPSRGKDMDGKTPNEVYYQNLAAKREVVDRKALALLCGTFETRTVHKNGITFRHRDYWNEKLLPFLNQRVIINFVPENMDVLNVFDEDLRAICTAAAKVRTPFRNTTEADYREAARQKKKARKLVEEYRPRMELDTISMIASMHLEEQAARDSEYRPAAVEQVAAKIDLKELHRKGSSAGCVEPDEPDLQSIALNNFREEEKQRKMGGF